MESAEGIPPQREAKQVIPISDFARTHFTNPIREEDNRPVTRLDDLTKRFGQKKAQAYTDFVTTLTTRLAAKPSERSPLEAIYARYNPEDLVFSSTEVAEIDGLAKKVYEEFLDKKHASQENLDDYDQDWTTEAHGADTYLDDHQDGDNRYS